MSAPSRLAFEALAGGYGGVDVVRGISGGVAAGEVLCVIGRNGVGKSTLLKMLFGEVACRVGTIRFDGRAIERLEPVERQGLGISYCPQERPVFDELSVRDNLTLMRADRELAAFAPLFRAFRSSRNASASTPERSRVARRRSFRSSAASRRRSR